jgi:hypothetical protein
MSERKVLNKYYPPDFDASKLPRVKREKNRQFTIRLMAPFNMRCSTCGEYIYRGKKFNARKEDVIGNLYLGIQIYRFYIKCTKCLAEITFLTDPENQDYAMENGAIRNFESVRLAEKQAEADEKRLKDEEVNNPMKILENRTRDSRREMDVLETLEDLRELNAAHATVDPKILLEEEEKRKRDLLAEQRQTEIDQDEWELKQIMGLQSKNDKKIKHQSDSDDDQEEEETSSKKSKLNVTEKAFVPRPIVTLAVKPNIGSSSRMGLLGIKKKTSVATTATQVPSVPPPGLLSGLLGDYDSSGDENSD